MNSAVAKRWCSTRFSLQLLFAAITLICIWLALKVNAARRQREAVAAILKTGGGSVVYDYEMLPVPGSPNRLQYYSC